MNVLPGRASRARRPRVGDATIAARPRTYPRPAARAAIELGIRPEFARLTRAGRRTCRCTVTPHRRSRARADRPRRASPARPWSRAGARRACRLTGDGGRRRRSIPAHIHVYADGQLVAGEARVMDKPLNNRAWFLVLPVLRDRRLLGGPAADDGGQLFGPGHVRQQPVLLERHRLVPGTARSLDASSAGASSSAAGATSCSPPSSSPSRCRSASWSRCAMPRKGWTVALLPRPDGAAAADPVERRRHDLAGVRARRHRPSRLHRQLARASTTTTCRIRSRPGSPSS